jgi:hypothetical protein
MKGVFTLIRYFGTTIIREKIIVMLIFLLPVILVIAGVGGTPDRDLVILLDTKFIQVEILEISVILYTVTAIALTSSVVSFFLSYNVKQVIPRLIQSNYSRLQIVLSFIIVIMIINLFLTIAIAFFSLIWILEIIFIGYIIGLFLTSIIFSTLGLILAELVDTLTLGLIGILTLAVLDTAFLENPIYSRRYNEDWMFLMPSHESIQLIFRALLDTGVHWSANLLFIIGYELFLITIYYLIIKYRRKLDG